MITAGLSRLSVVGASIASAFLAVVAYFETLLTGITSLFGIFDDFAQGIQAKLLPFQTAVAGNDWLLLFGYSANLDTFFAVFGSIMTAFVTVLLLVVSCAVGFVVLYTGFVVLAWVLRLLKGLTASFIDFT
jgi:hypothetical protein